MIHFFEYALLFSTIQVSFCSLVVKSIICVSYAWYIGHRLSIVCA
jgi:hypothetical protein